MNNKKPVFLLAGGRKKGMESMNSLLREIFSQTGRESPSIGYIGAPNDDSLMFYGMMCGMLKTAGAGKINRVMLASSRANIAKAKDILRQVDIIFMSGGDVDRGMEIVNQREMGDFLLDLSEAGKVFFGTSAGSIMLASQWVRWKDPDDDSTAELFPCLDLAPVICDTHGEEEWEELQALLRLKDNGTVGYGIISGVALEVWPDGRVAARGGPVNRFLKDEGTVKAIADLLP